MDWVCVCGGGVSPSLALTEGFSRVSETKLNSYLLPTRRLLLLPTCYLASSTSRKVCYVPDVGGVDTHADPDLVLAAAVQVLSVVTSLRTLGFVLSIHCSTATTRAFESDQHLFDE